MSLRDKKVFFILRETMGMAWWWMLVIPALKRLRPEDFKLKPSLGCIERDSISQERGRERGREGENASE